MWSFIVALSWMVLHVLLVSCTEGQRIDSPSKSCLDHLKSGATKNGYYSIIDQSGSSLTVYCDFESEPGSAWTLVISWSLENNNLPAFRSTSLTDDAPVNEKTPNWIVYRQSKKAMDLIKSQSSHWRATCSFNKVKIDYRDYVRGKVADFDITTYLGNGQCKTIEYVNIRGHVGYRTTVGFFSEKKCFHAAHRQPTWWMPIQCCKRSAT